MPDHTVFSRFITRAREAAIARQVATPAPAPPTASRLVEAARARLATAAQIPAPAPASLIDRVRSATLARTTRPEALPAAKQREQRDSSVSASEAISIFQTEMRELKGEMLNLVKQQATFNEQLLLDQRRIIRRNHPTAFSPFEITAGAPQTDVLLRVRVDGVSLHKIIWGSSAATNIIFDIVNNKLGRVQRIIRAFSAPDRTEPLDFGEIGIEIPRGSDIRGTTATAVSYRGQLQLSGMPRAIL